MNISADRLEQLRCDVDRLAEQIADVSLDLLHQALSDPDPKASPAARAEKVATRARLSVEKASHLLASIDLDDADR